MSVQNDSTCFSQINNNLIEFNQINGLKIVFHNIRSLVHHYEEVQSFLADNKIDVYCCVETWLTNKHFDKEFDLNNYQLFRCDRNGRRGGGVCIYVKDSDNYFCSLVHKSVDKYYQTIHLKVKQRETNQFHVICVYRPPDVRAENDTNFFEYLETVSEEDIIIGGDFNVDFNDKQNKSWFEKWSDLGLSQVIATPTRITDTSETVIDHIYVNNLNKVFDCGTIDFEISDHKPIFISRKSPKMRHSLPKSIEVYNWKRFDRKGFEESILKLFITYERISDIDKCVTTFTENIINLMNEYLPKKVIRFRIRSLPFVDHRIRKLMRERNKTKNLFNKLRRSGLIRNELYDKYKDLRNKVNIEIKRLKKCWFQKRIQENIKDIRKLWRIVDEIIPTKKSMKNKVKENDLNLDQINHHFVTIPTQMVQAFGESYQFDDLSPKSDQTFSLPEVSEEAVKKIIENLDPKKSVGFDGLSAKLFKKCMFLLPFIVFLISKSFKDLKVPEIWKIGAVKALHKSGPKNILSNFRPISVLPTITKILEKLIYEKLYQFLIDNRLLSSKQFGFRSGHSCTDAILCLINNVFKAKNSGKKVCVVSIDISKAFDTVSHPILLHKLYRLGMDWDSIQWFNSYLTDRKQFVRNGKLTSNTLNISVGVPQGSILGPLLFAIYLNDLLELPLNGDIFSYADDCNLVYFADNYEELQEKVQTSLNLINKWMSDNRLTLNAKKSNYMCIDFTGRPTSELSLLIGDNTISKVSSTKLLGIYIDDRLAFKTHVDYVCKQMSSRIGLISRMKKFLPKETLNMLYKSLVQPVVDYGLPVYGFTYESHFKRIQKLQNRSSRLISSSSQEYNVLFKELNWKTFVERRNYFSFIFIFKCLNRLTPEECHPLFEIRQSAIMTKSVSNQELAVPRKYSQTFANSIFYTGITLFNKLDKSLRKLPDFRLFLNALKKV